MCIWLQTDKPTYMRIYRQASFILIHCLFFGKALANIYFLSVCLSVCLSGHVYFCFYPSVCLNMHMYVPFRVYVQTDRRIKNINTHVLTDRQTDRHYILASAFPKNRQWIKMKLACLTDRQYILASVYTKTRQRIKMELIENEFSVIALCQTC